MSAESALLTFLIADVRGYTRFTVERGDEAAARLAMTFAQLTTEVVDSAGGRVVELRGDEVLAVFSSARQALRAALELQECFGRETSDDLPLRAGIGIDAGEAVVVEKGYRGSALNLAARLCTLAGPGEVLTSETVTNLARKVDGLTYVERGATQLKGFTSKVMVMQVLPEERPVHMTREEPRVDEQRLPIGGFLGALPSNPLVARNEELEHVLKDIGEVQAGQGRLVLLTGEPGVGKTRLAQEVSLQARNLGFLVASGRCYEPEETVPYYPFREAIATLYNAAPGIIRAEVPRTWPYLVQILPRDAGYPAPTSGSSGEEQHRLLYAVTSFIHALSERQPVAILLDDLHWADESSLKLLQYVARHSRASSVFILGTYRDVEVSRQHPLERALRDLDREGLTEEIAVRRLDRKGTAALTAATFGESDVSPEFAELLYSHTEGNAFFTHEVLRALVERGSIYEENGQWERREVREIEIPRSVRSTIGERVARLPDEAQEILLEASVLGQTFGFNDLHRLGGRDEDVIEKALDAAQVAGLVRLQDRDVYAFNHALTQQVLYDELSPRRRRRLHLAAGAAIESGQRAGQRISELAWHFLQGDDPEKTLDYALKAGGVAEELFAHSEAVRHYRVAVELARELQDRTREAEALAKLGDALGHGTDLDQAVRYLKDADSLFQALGDFESQRRVIARAAQLMGVRRVEDQTVQRRFDELLETSEPSVGLAELLIWRSQLAFASGRYHESLVTAVRAGEIARTVGSDFLLADAELRRGTALSFAREGSSFHDAGVEVLEEALQLAERSGNMRALSTALNNIAFSYLLRGDLEANLTYRRRSLDLAERGSEAIGLIFGHAMVAQALTVMGRLAEANVHGEESVSRAQAMDPLWHSAYASLELARIRVMEGRWEESQALLEEGIRIANSHHDSQCASLYREISAERALLRDQPAEVLELIAGIPEDALDIWGLWTAAAACIAVGDSAQAENIVERMIHVGGWVAPDGYRLRGVLAARRGAWHQAVTDLDHAADIARGQGYGPGEGRAVHDLGIVLAAGGDRDRGRERLDSALRLFQEMGAHAYADRTKRAITGL